MPHVLAIAPVRIKATLYALHSSILFFLKAKMLPWTKENVATTLVLVMPKFSSELKFKPEILRTGPRFSSKFSAFVELDLKFSSGFSRIKEVQTWFKPIALVEP